MKLFFDTETTGLANFKLPPDSAGQPRLVQLGAILTDSEGKELFTVNAIVKPDGFEIPKESSNVHGITTEKAISQGLPLRTVISIFLNLRRLSSICIGHNLDYDDFIIRGELIRADLIKHYEIKENFCTMKVLTNICKIPNKTNNGYKYPRLAEAYKFAFGKEFEGAHDAMADIRATKELYTWIMEK